MAKVLKNSKSIAIKTILSFGGNLENVLSSFEKALLLLKKTENKLTNCSSVFSTAPWGKSSENNYLNMVAVYQTLLPPEELLEECLKIEKDLGRVREGNKKWADRIIDIDILFYGSLEIETPNLIIPHPYLHERNFILYPLNQVCPDFLHPKLNKTVRVLKNECQDKRWIEELKNGIRYEKL